MKLDKNITKELQGVAPMLAKLDKVNLYQVEEGYFRNSQLHIIGLVEKQNTSLLASVPKMELYTAPADSYFAAFSDKLMEKVRTEEVAEELSYALPVLAHVEKRNLYNVPAAYFNAFPKSIAKLVAKESAESPVAHWAGIWNGFMEMILDRVARPRYAFAMASVLGMIVCIGLVVNNKSGLSDEDKIFSQMQQISDADLHHYVAKHRDEFDERIILNNINNVDFTHYFDKPEQVTPHIESHTKGQADDEIANEDILD